MLPLPSATGRSSGTLTAGYASGPANKLRSHFRPAPIAFSTPRERKPVIATASKAIAPPLVDHLPVTAMVVPISVITQILMPMASASLSPASRSGDRRAQPSPGSSRQATAIETRRSVPTRPVATSKTAPIDMATANATASLFVNQDTFAGSYRTILIDADHMRFSNNGLPIPFFGPAGSRSIGQGRRGCDSITNPSRAMLIRHVFLRSGNDCPSGWIA